MASAILTTIDQDRYTIIDVRALDALGPPKMAADNVNFYLNQYFPECKRLAETAKISLRAVDRALWTWGKENGYKRISSLSG